MKYELKFFISSLLIIVLAIFSHANDDYIASQNKDYNIKSKILYTKYTNIPKVVYTNQRFTVTISADVLISYANIPYKIHTYINKDNKNIELINQDIIWEKIKANKYETQLQFKVVSDEVVLPQIRISLIDEENEILDESVIKNKKIIYRKIAINQKRYSQIIAKSLIVTSLKTKQYTNNELIHVLVIDAKQSNLEDFKLFKYEAQGQKVLNTNEDTQTLYYYIITPRGEKNIEFNYFNTNKNKFVNINVPINLQEELVSTQTDLNPYENDMYIYKVIAISIVVLFFLMVYYFKREFFFLFFAVIFMTLLIYMIWPNSKIILNKNTKVYILPTSNSTIFSIIKKKEEVEILIKKDHFIKVLFKNKNIGWVNNG